MSSHTSDRYQLGNKIQFIHLNWFFIYLSHMTDSSESPSVINSTHNNTVTYSGKHYTWVKCIELTKIHFYVHWLFIQLTYCHKYSKEGIHQTSIHTINNKPEQYLLTGTDTYWTYWWWLLVHMSLIFIIYFTVFKILNFNWIYGTFIYRHL